jgi:hypothetical protein
MQLAERKLAPNVANRPSSLKLFVSAVCSSVECVSDSSLLDHDTARLTQYIQLCDVAAVHKRC